MMFSPELRIAVLIWVLYGSTCFVLLYANEGLVQRAFGGLRMRIAEDHLRILGRSPVCLNPLLPMFPAFRARWGDALDVTEQAALPQPVAEALAASAILAPYVFAVFLYTVIALPAVVLFLGAARALPILLLAYAAIAIMLIRLWFLRGRFAINGRKFALLAFECVVCAPLASGIVRRLSLAVPLEGDLAKYLDAMPQAETVRALEQLARCCRAREAACEEGSPEQDRMMRYAKGLAEYRLRNGTPGQEGEAGCTQPREGRPGPAAGSPR